MSSVEAEVGPVLDEIISKIVEQSSESSEVVNHQGAAAAFQAGSRWMGKVGGAFGKPISSKRAFKLPSFKAPSFKAPSFKAPESDLTSWVAGVAFSAASSASSAASSASSAASSASSAASIASSGMQESLHNFKNRTQESRQLSAMITSLCELEKKISIFDLQSSGTCSFDEICPLTYQIKLSTKYSKLVEAYLSKTGSLKTGSLSENLIKDLDRIWDAKYITRDEIVEKTLNVPSADKSFELRRESLYNLSLRCNSPADIFLYWTDKVSQLLADVVSKTILADATYWKMRLAIEIIRNCLLPLSQQNIQPEKMSYNLIPGFNEKKFGFLARSLISFREDSGTIENFNSLVKIFNSDFVSYTRQVYRSMVSIDNSGKDVVSEEEQRKAAIAIAEKKAEEKRNLEDFQKSQAKAAVEQLEKDEARKKEEATEEAIEAQKEQAKQKAFAKALRNDCRLQRIEFWGAWQKSRLLSSNLAGVVDMPQHINHKRDEFENLAKINWQSFLYSENDFKADSLADPINAMDKVRSNYYKFSNEIGSLQKFVYAQRYKLSARWQRVKIDTKSVFKVYERALENMQVSLDKAYKHTVSKQHDLLSPAIMGAVSSCYNDIVESLEQKDLKERDFVDISKEMQTDIAKFSSFNEKLSQAHDEFFFHDDICQQAWMAYLDVLNMQYRIKLSGDVFRAPDISSKGETYQKFYQYVSQIPQVADIDLFTLRDFDVLYQKSKSSYVKLDILLQEAQSLRRLNILKYEGDSAQFSLLNLDDKFESRALEITPLQTQAVGSWVRLSRNLSKFESLKDKSVSPAILEEYITHTRRNFQQQSNAYKRLTDSFIFVYPCGNSSLSRDASSPVSSDEDSASARPHAFFGEASKEGSSPLALTQVESVLNSGDIDVGIHIQDARAPELSRGQRISAAVVKNKYKFITSAALLVVGAGAMIAAPYIAAAAFVTVAIVAGCVALGVGGALGLLGCVSSACAFRNSTRESVAEAAQAEV